MIDQDKLLQPGSHASAPASVDLGPLAWVVDSLHDTLNDVREQLTTFSEEVKAASGSHLTTLDTAVLREAAQSLHEAVGVLDLVERPAAAKVAGAMERCVQLFITNPELCTPDAAQTVVQAGISVLDYLGNLLKGRPDLSPGLFPAYRDVAQLAGIDRIHPADLWHGPWQWLEVKDFAPPPTEHAPQSASAPAFLDGVLQLFRSNGASGAEQLAARTQQLWQQGTAAKERVFWQLANAFLQLQAAQALNFDDQIKRLLSRVAVQYDLLQQQAQPGEVSERLAQDLLYFIALGHHKKPSAPAPLAQAIAQRYQLDTFPVSDYDQLLYGTVDPAHRRRLREAIATFKDLWSDVSSGNTHKVQALSTQCETLAQSMHALWPATEPFSQALRGIIAQTAQSGQAPHPDVAMEVATAILFLEASTEEQPGDCQLFEERTALLAQRLQAVQRSEHMEPPTEWMEALYARLNDQDSMAQVVAEAHTSISEVEQALDDFFRHPQKTQQAAESISKLDKIAGVLLTLDFEDASRAVKAMTQQVQQLVEASEKTGSIDEPEDQYVMLKLGNSLGALSFMIDMMAYQPALAKAQFYFDETAQELAHRNVAISAPAGAPAAPDGQEQPSSGSGSTSAQLGQTHIPALDDLVNAQAAGTLSNATAAEQLGGVIQQAELAGQPALAQQARQALDSIQAADAEDTDTVAQAVSSLAPAPAQPTLPEDGIVDAPIEEEDLRDIFLEEAAEVIGNALNAIESLQGNLADTAQLTNLRRAFHTLKGSGRMVGLASFGEAAWEMERMLNAWLADAKPATPALLQLATNALEALTEWRESIFRQEKTRWHHAYFSQPAASMQESGNFLPILVPGDAPLQSALPPDAVESAQAEALFAPESPVVAEDIAAPATLTDADAPTPAAPASHVLETPAAETVFADDEQAVFAEEAAPAPPSSSTSDHAAPALPALPDLDGFSLAPPSEAAAEPDVFADEEPSPFADALSSTASDAPALQLAQFVADLPSLDLETPAADAPLASPASTDALATASEHAPKPGATLPALTTSQATDQTAPASEASSAEEEVLFAPETDAVEADTVEINAVFAAEDSAPDAQPTAADPQTAIEQTEDPFKTPFEFTFDLPETAGATTPSADSGKETAASQTATATADGALFANVSAPQAFEPGRSVTDTNAGAPLLPDFDAFATPGTTSTSVTASAPTSTLLPSSLAAESPAQAAPTFDDALIHNALAAMLVDTTPQQAVLQDMVDGLPEEEVKRVGDMRIPLALFNAYLNEADVWSRQLAQELGEWILTCHKPVPHTCEQLAHSLAGSSAAVGMGGLASMARGLEHAIARIAQRTARADEASTLHHAAEVVRQELHQFAAGLRHPVNMALLCKLAAIVENVPLATLDTLVPDPKALRLEQFASTEKKNTEDESGGEAAAAIAAAANTTQAATTPAAAIAIADESAATSATSAKQTPATDAAADVAGATDAAETVAKAKVEAEAEPTPAADSTQPGGGAQADILPLQAAQTPARLTDAQSANAQLTDAKLADAQAPSSAPATPVPAAAPSQPLTTVRTAPTAAPALATYDDTPDAIDPDLFEFFSEEAQTLLPQLNAVMRQWIAHPDNTGARTEAQRLLHTLKGGARLAGAMQMGAMVHDMESAIGDLGTLGKNAESVQALEQLQAMLDEVDAHFTRLLDNEPAPALSASAAAAEPAPASSPSTADAAATGSATAPATVATEPEASAAPGETSADSSVQTPGTALSAASSNTQAASGAIAMPVASHMPAPHGLMQQQVRVRSKVLDRMLGSTGEVMISRARLESEVQHLRQAMKDMDGSLDRLRAQLRDMELQAETQMQSRMAQTAENAANFDPLEFDRFTRVQELTRMMAESVNDVASVQRTMIRTVQASEDNLIAQARQARELQDDLLRSRMVEFDSLSERLYRVVRQAAKETGKQVTLNIVGAQTTMDRNIIDRIAAPFEHLLRNAVVHGIESPEQRVLAGKEPTGHIEISLQQEGNDVAIVVRDDGKGLDVARIREKAIANKLLAADAKVSDEDAMQLIFQSGLSTTDSVTSLAGRGVGMDVVRSEVNALGGRIETSSRAQKGTAFTLVLPLTSAVTQVVEVQAGELHFGVPSNLIETVLRASAKEIQQAYNARTFTVHGESLPFYWAGAMLQSSQRSADTSAKRQVVLVLRSAAQRIVMHVDSVVGNHEVVVKNIGPQLARMPGLSGITILPSGSALFIYNPVALSFTYEEQIRAFSADRADPATLGGDAKPAAPLAPLVLVVDDSITVRRVTGRLLQREGYRVTAAADGVAALRAIANERPDIVLSDIEMPQMDGFDLLRNIRSSDEFKDLPVIMITSRTADKHRDHATELGATGFLGKPYPEEAMLDLLRKHARLPVAKKS